MQFNSIGFLFVFLPLFLILYGVTKAWLRNLVLVGGSIVFYGFACNWNLLALGILLAVTVITYPLALQLAKRGRGWLLGICLGTLAAVLVFFKLFAGGRYLPVGMSFYLFQTAAMLIDNYRGTVEPEKNFLHHSAGLVMFPKILSGPIVSPRTLQEQSRGCNTGFDAIHKGLQTFVLGLAMKVIVANRLGGFWNQGSVLGYDIISPAFAWTSLIAYALRLYLDFQGYSLMAIGLGRMLGYELPHNFRDPYAATSIAQFYRRWHITLGAWFREYIYIPLGGNRKGQLITILNLAVVWAFTGFWHGVGGNYLVWAGILLFCIVNERLWLGKLLNKAKVISHIYTIGVILLSWVPFAIGDWGQMMTFFGKLFGMGAVVANPMDFVAYGGHYVVPFTAGLILATPLPGFLWKKVKSDLLKDIICLVLFWVSVFYIATAAQDPAMYSAF